MSHYYYCLRQQPPPKKGLDGMYVFMSCGYFSDKKVRYVRYRTVRTVHVKMAWVEFILDRNDVKHLYGTIVQYYGTDRKVNQLRICNFLRVSDSFDIHNMFLCT